MFTLAQKTSRRLGRGGRDGLGITQQISRGKRRHGTESNYMGKCIEIKLGAGGI